MKEILKTKRTKIVLLSLIAIFVCSAGLVTLAILTSKTGELKNEFKLGNVTTEIEEEFDKDTEDPWTFHKKIQIKNTGKNECYIRVRISPSPENQLEVTYSQEESNKWSQDEDGEYWYYTDPVAPNALTDPLFVKATVLADYQATIESLEIIVYQEAVQAKMNAEDGSSTSCMKCIWDAYDVDENEVPANFTHMNIEQHEE